MGLSHVSLLILGGRIPAPMRYGAYQAARIDRAKEQTDLVLRDGTFYSNPDSAHSTARVSARILASVSWYSYSGTESATTPPDAWI